jgi:hypothetical protein
VGELAALEVRFALASGHIYVRAASSESGRLRAHAEFVRLLAAEDFAGDADRLVVRGRAALREAGAPLREAAPAPAAAPRGGRRGTGAPRAATKPAAPAAAALQRLLDVYPWDGGERGNEPSLARGAAQRVRYDLCPACGADMAVDAGRSELQCGACGAVSELVGTVFDDSQFYSQEGQKAKSGTFNPNRHFQFWWAHLLARESEEEIGDKDDPENLYGEKLLALLRVFVRRDQHVLLMLTVDDVRAMLREADRTDLYKNVPLILKKLTGVGPPSPPEALAVQAENLFTKAIEAGERLRRPDRVNRNYYPYYISRIVEFLVPEEDRENRRLLYYVHVQSRETVESDDRDWEQICRELAPELAYKPTDRSLGLKYGPSCY